MSARGHHHVRVGDAIQSTCHSRCALTGERLPLAVGLTWQDEAPCGATGDLRLLRLRRHQGEAVAVQLARLGAGADGQEAEQGEGEWKAHAGHLVGRSASG